MTPEEVGRKAKLKYPQYRNMSDEEVGRKIIAKYPQYGETKETVKSQSEKKSGGFMSALQKSITPAKEAYQGLKTLYGGSDQGIAAKLRDDVQSGADEMAKGNYRKGALKSGGRVAGDVAGTIFAPVGAAIQSTGINKVFDYASKKFGESKVGQAISDNKMVQNFAMAHPNAEEDFGRILNLAMSGGGGKVTSKGLTEVASIPVTAAKNTKIAAGNVVTGVRNSVNKAKSSDVFNIDAKTIAKERQAKLNEGFSEQNVRLKSANNAFNKYTKTYTEKAIDPNTGVETATKKKVTPIDTFAKHNIAPEVEKGAIQMGDYETGVGPRGKIKSAVKELEAQIESRLNETVQLNSLENLKKEVIQRIKSDAALRETGDVSSTIKKLEGVFSDYKESFGDTVTNAQLNGIRRRMNKKYNPDTVDVQRVIGDAAREVIYNTTSDGSIKAMLREVGELLSADSYAKAINGTKVTGGRLGNYAARTAGAIIGSTVKNAPILGPVVGMMGGEMAARLLQQTQFKSAWTELKALLQSKSSEPSQRAKIIPKRESIPFNFKSEPVKKVGNPIPTISRYAEKAKGKGGLNLQTVGDGKAGYSDPLLQEARKYKSAEEFVKSKVNMYHGTPYEFDKFDSSKIMTGEAENAMGRGLYMTDSPNVADYYKRTVTKKPVVALKNVDGTDVDARTLGQITFLKENKLAELPKEQQVALIKQQINAMEDLVRQRNASPDSEIGKLLASYKKIDPDSISVSKYNNRVVKAYGDNSSFIDTKAPLSNEQVTKLKKALGDNYLDWNNIKDGQDLYFKLARKRKNPEKVLSDAGIKGMKYPVGELSAKQYGGSNYVFFDDKNLLTEKQLTDLWKKAQGETKRGFGTGAGRPKTITKAQDSKITKSSLQEVLQDGAREYIKILEKAKTIDFDAVAKYQDLLKRAPKITDIQSLTRNIAELERKSKLNLLDEAIKIRNEVFDGLRKKNLKK